MLAHKTPFIRENLTQEGQSTIFYLKWQLLFLVERFAEYYFFLHIVNFSHKKQSTNVLRFNVFTNMLSDVTNFKMLLDKSCVEKTGEVTLINRLRKQVGQHQLSCLVVLNR